MAVTKVRAVAAMKSIPPKLIRDTSLVIGGAIAVGASMLFAGYATRHHQVAKWEQTREEMIRKHELSLAGTPTIVPPVLYREKLATNKLAFEKHKTDFVAQAPIEIGPSEAGELSASALSDTALKNDLRYKKLLELGYDPQTAEAALKKHQELNTTHDVAPATATVSTAPAPATTEAMPPAATTTATTTTPAATGGTSSLASWFPSSGKDVKETVAPVPPKVPESVPVTSTKPKPSSTFGGLSKALAGKKVAKPINSWKMGNPIEEGADATASAANFVPKAQAYRESSEW
jgi:hypothetical protein